MNRAAWALAWLARGAVLGAAAVALMLALRGPDSGRTWPVNCRGPVQDPALQPACRRCAADVVDSLVPCSPGLKT